MWPAVRNAIAKCEALTQPFNSVLNQQIRVWYSLFPFQH